jgi:hypothetical protein
VPKVTTRSLYPECIANLKLPIDAFYRESRSGVNIAKRIITTGLFGLGRIQDFKSGGRILKNCAERREARKYLGYFVWKITILCQKIIFFPILGGVRAGCAPLDPLLLFRITEITESLSKTGQVILPTISSMYTISNYLASCFLWIDLSTDSVQAKENKAKSHKPNNKIGTH